MARALLLGEAPGPSGGTRDPLGRKTAKRLCEFAGWSPEPYGEDPWREALVRRFELRNLLDYQLPKAGKGTLWPLHEARTAAERVDLDRPVVCLGKRVAAAIGAPEEYFVILAVRRPRVVVTIPHPSGINRVLNDPEMREWTGWVLRMMANLDTVEMKPLGATKTSEASDGRAAEDVRARRGCA